MAGRFRNVPENRFEKRPQIAGSIVKRCSGDAGPRIRINDWKFELLFGGIEVDEKIVQFVDDFLDSGVGPVDLIDDGNSRQLGFESFHENITRLWKRSLAGVHEQKNTVHHLQRPLDFTPVVAMTRRIHDVDFYPVIPDTRSLGENRDSALALEIVGIENALHYFFICPENAALPQHGIDQRRLPVIDVSNDGYVANRAVMHNLPSYKRGISHKKAQKAQKLVFCAFCASLSLFFLFFNVGTPRVRDG